MFPHLQFHHQLNREVLNQVRCCFQVNFRDKLALKVKEDDELVRVRLNVLENDVRKIKQRLEIA
jgi:hypothetical protein